MLAYGTPVELSKIGRREFYYPVRNKTGGFIGVLRVVFTGLEILTFFLPLGQVVSATTLPILQASIGLGFAGAQAALTGASYAQGNIRSTGSLFGALSIDILPAGVFFGTAVRSGLRTELIVVESLNEALEAQKVERVYTRKASEFRDMNKMVKSKGVRTLNRVNELGGMEKVSRLRGSEALKYRKAYITQAAARGEDTAEIVFDQFEVAMNNAFPNATNQDRALIRRIRYSKNLLATDYDRYVELIQDTAGALSKQTRGYIKSLGKDPHAVLTELTRYVNSRSLTSIINKKFASGNSDWASKEFYTNFRKSKTIKSGNFWTQALQMPNANDLGREIITKPFNALIRKNKKFMDNLRKDYVEPKLAKWIKQYGDDVVREEEIILEEVKVLNKKYKKQVNKIYKENPDKSKKMIHRLKSKAAKKIYKGSVYANKLKKSIEKAGGYYCGESFVMGWRTLQDMGNGMKTVQIHFNRVTTNAFSAGSKNRGGKHDVIMPITDMQLKAWRRSSNKSSYYLRHFALSRGGRPIGYAVSSHLFANFLSAVPLPALRNILSMVSNLKSVGSDMVHGTYFKEWVGNFERTVKRLWIHKVGKLAGSYAGILGHGAGKEGQRIGLAIARGFQHREGQSFGAFSSRALVKEALPQGFRGTALRRGRRRIRGGHLPSVGQAKLSTSRYLTNLRRIGSIPKIK